MKCSDLSMKMYKTKEGRCKVAFKATYIVHTCKTYWGKAVWSSSGEQLRSLLIKHGNFKQLELQLSKWHKNTEKDARLGMWVTRQYLMEEKKYTKPPSLINIVLKYPKH